MSIIGKAEQNDSTMNGSIMNGSMINSSMMNKLSMNQLIKNLNDECDKLKKQMCNFRDIMWEYEETYNSDLKSFERLRNAYDAEIKKHMLSIYKISKIILGGCLVKIESISGNFNEMCGKIYVKIMNKQLNALGQHVNSEWNFITNKNKHKQIIILITTMNSFIKFINSNGEIMLLTNSLEYSFVDLNGNTIKINDLVNQFEFKLIDLLTVDFYDMTSHH